MKSGIYRITNTINGKVYIGSAKDFEKRWKRHRNDATAGKHSSILFQRSWDKYGGDSFVFEIVERIEYDKTSILMREDYWMGVYKSRNPDFGFNLAPASFGDVLSTHPNRDDIIKRISQTCRENVAKMTCEERVAKWGKFGADNGNYRPDNFHMCHCGSGIRLSNRDTYCKKCAPAIDRSGDKNSFYGKKHTAETKAKIAASRAGKAPSNKKNVIIDGVNAGTVTEVISRFGISASLVTYRVKSSKYNWSYINAQRLSNGG